MLKIAKARTLHHPAELLDRGLPHDFEAERAVLGCAIMRPALFGMIAGVLSAEDFFSDTNRKIFGAMLRLHRQGRPIDATLLIGELRDHGELTLDRTGVMYGDLVELFGWHPSPDHLQYYAARVADLTRRRQTFSLGIRLIQAANSGESGDTLPSPAIRRATRQAIDRRIKRCKRARR